MLQNCFDLKEFDKKIMRSIFFNIDELSSYVKKAPVNEIFRNEELSSSKRKESGFNDFDSFEDALKAMEYGYSTHLEDLKKEMQKAQNFIFEKAMKKNSNYKKDITGFVPVVPNVIVGNPINMINQDVSQRKIPVCKIIIEKSISCGIKSRDSIRFYSVLFTLIQLIEQKGIRCELWICSTAGNSDEVHTFKLKLKEATQPINIFKLQFPIISSDMFRRIGFRLIETCPDMKTNWTWGYGRRIADEDWLSRDDDYKPNISMQKILDIDKNWVYIPDIGTAKMEGKDTEKIFEYLTQKTALKHYIKIAKK